MKVISRLVGGCVAAVAAQSATLDLTGVASGTSRFYDHFSDGFGQVDRDPQGFYAISNPSQLYGSGYAVFPQGADFRLGTLSYHDITGVGSESAALTALTGDWNANVDPSFGAYRTRFSDITGTAQFQDGVWVGLNLSSSVTFTYTDGPIVGAAYTGAFTVAGETWSLQADNAFNLPVRQEWDLSGTVNVVPEPGPLALTGIGVFLVWIGCRRCR